MHLRKSSFRPIALAACSLTLFSTHLSASIPAISSLSIPSEPTLEQRLDWIQSEIEKARVEGQVPGIGFALIVDGKLVLERGFGQANSKAQTPANEHTRFAVGSTTKAFTAALASILADEATLSLDDHPRKYLPWLTVADPEADANLTFRDLLSHRTGHAAMTQVWYGVDTLSRRQVLDHYMKAQLLHPFRSKWNYSNESFLAAGLATAAAAQTDWDALLRDRLLIPLGMTNSNSTIDAAHQDPEMALGYYVNPETDQLEYQPLRSIDHVAPAGSINSSAHDMARWVLFQLGRGQVDNQRIASAAAVEETWKKHSTMAPTIDYGLGWMIAEWEDRRIITHAGGIDGFSAEVAFLPDHNFGVVVLSNLFASPVPQQARDIALRGIFNPLPTDTDPAAPAAEDLSRYTGTYIANFGPFNDAEMPVTIQNGRLAVQVPGQTTYELNPPDESGKRPFVITNTIAVSFNESPQGDIYSFTFHQGGMKFDVFRKDAEIPVEIDLDAAREYLGIYRVDAGGPKIDIDVRIQNNRLAVNIPGQMVYELFPPNDEGWCILRATDLIAIRFNRDDNGNVVSMTQRQSGNEITMQRVGDAPSDLPSPAQLMEYIAATLDTKNHLESLHIDATVSVPHQGMSGNETILCDAAGNIARLIDLNDGRVSHAWVHENSGTSRVYAVSTDITMSPAMIAGVRQASPLFWARDWRERFQRVTVTAREQHDGREVYVVRCSHPDQPTPTIVHVDIETGLPDTMIITARNMLGMDVTVTQKLSDYREVEGVKIAHQISTSIEAAGDSVTTFNRVTPNVPTDPSLFSPSPR